MHFRTNKKAITIGQALAETFVRVQGTNGHVVDLDSELKSGVKDMVEVDKGEIEIGEKYNLLLKMFFFY